MTPAAAGQYPGRVRSAPLAAAFTQGAVLLRPRLRAERIRGLAPAPIRVLNELVIEASESTREAHPPRRRVALLWATGGGVGYLPLAPGSFGSAVGILLYLPLAGLGPGLFAVTVLGLLFLGIWAADEAERVFERKDDGRIVIDEIVGQLLTLAPLVALAPRVDLRSPLLLVTGFVLFRCLDIWKPGPARWAEQSFRGGAGVVLDDVVAGALAAMLLGAVALAVEGA